LLGIKGGPGVGSENGTQPLQRGLQQPGCVVKPTELHEPVRQLDRRDQGFLCVRAEDDT